MARDTELQRSWKVCFHHLPKVSRTFALAIDGLTEPLRDAVCVAYLQCRILDTIEDAPGLESSERRSLMAPFLGALPSGRPPGAKWLEEVEMRLAGRSADADLELLRSTESVLECYWSLEESTRLAVARWVTEMGKGMAAWSERMGEGPGTLKTLPSPEALDRYCYYIAGTVGYLLTDLFFIASPLVNRSLFYRLQADAEAFGLGLQKVNILKDLADDYRRGWCFLPTTDLEAQGLAPADLAEPARADAVYRAALPTLAAAARHLESAWHYLEAMPVGEREIRLFLAYSLFFALETLALVAEKPERLAGDSKLKISRAKVARVVAALQRKIGDPGALADHYRKTAAPLSVFARDLARLRCD